MKSLLLHIVILLATCSFLAACTADTTCRQDLTVRMNVTLQGDSLNDKLHNVRYTSWDSITVQIIGEDSILLDNRKASSSCLCSYILQRPKLVLHLRLLL